MIRELAKLLTIREQDLPRVQPLLTILLRGITIVAIVPCLISITVLWGGQTDFKVWMIGGFLPLAAAWILYRRHQQAVDRSNDPDSDPAEAITSTTETTHLILATLILYATIAGPPEFLISAPTMMIYALPLVMAALLMSPASSLVWATIATVFFVARMILEPSSGLEAFDFFGFALIPASFYGIALVSGLLARSFRRDEEMLRLQIAKGQAGIEIGHTVTSSTDPTRVIRQAVELIHAAFRYYHVGLFVLDPEGDTATLRDAYGEGAENLKERGFHISLTGTSAVAASINQKRQLILVSWRETRDSRGRPVQFTYERLPTRSELVIPLQISDRVFGALDVHSTELEFPEEDLHTLEGLVGHISNALESARLLEDIQKRHQELSQVYAQTERRALYLETTAELARAVSSLVNPQDLLDRAVDLVSVGLDLYHTGIFLLDENEEWAVLTAASSEGGKRMLDKGHKLRAGEQGIVGWVTQTGKPRIALDVGEDAVFFNNRYLPNTRSEMALPLKAGNRVIGALDVQSVTEAAFTEEDIAVLQILADQITVAIQNARLFQQTQSALEEVQALQRYYVSQEWERTAAQRDDLKAEYRRLGVPSVETHLTPEMRLAFEQETPVVLPDLRGLTLDGNGSDGGHEEEPQSAISPLSALAIPIRLRGEVIGVLDLQETDEPRNWTAEEIAMATAVADQLALAVENARLFEESQRRAGQLAAAAEVARDATAILDVDRLLEETVNLISEQFGFYHAGAFLLDERNEYALLRAASSAGGKEMLAAGHRLQVGQVGIVGYVAASGEARVALDVGEDAVFFNNRYLPDTRSEMALPLKVRERVIGVLDVQSTAESAFSEDDVAVLQTLGDQLATAIANANLFQRVRQDAMRRSLINEVTQAAASSLEISELLNRSGLSMSRQLEMPCVIYDWDPITETMTPVAIYDAFGAEVTPDAPLGIIEEMDGAMFQAMQTRQLQVLFDVPAHVRGSAAQLAKMLDLVDSAYIPLLARGQVRGMLSLGRHQGHPAFDEGELSFIEVVASNLGVALEMPVCTKKPCTPLSGWPRWTGSRASSWPTCPTSCAHRSTRSLASPG